MPGAGMDDYIAKPVDFDRLLEMIDSWVTKAELATLVGRHADACRIAATPATDAARRPLLFSRLGLMRMS
jgi:DNA-binding response OmpR family regulator